jgi:uncharacterized protein (DUF2141 family)
MAGYRYLIGFLVFIVFGCAQVGTISGGEKDGHAPKPITAEVSPQNASTNMRLTEIKIPFDEYFALNNPVKNIQLIPPHATLTSRVKGKTLYLSWEKELEPNTTYAIYLNRAVKDLSEGNDSIMQYVFSTGSVLDSLSYSVPVVDAWTNAVVPNALVALYSPTSGEVLNFGLTGTSGSATLRYLKAQDYKIIAFNDENGDLFPQPSESVGFYDDSLITIDSSFRSIVPIRMFTPELKAEIVSSKFQAPSTFLIETNRPILNEELYLDGVLQPSTKYNLLTSTSLELFVDATDLTTGTIILASDLLTDTASYRLLAAQKNGLIRIKSDPTSGVYAPNDSIRFLVNDLITAVDTSLFNLISLEDSSELIAPIFWINNALIFQMDRGISTTYSLRMDAGAIQTTSGTNTAFSTTFTLNSPKKYGVLSLDLSYYQSDFVLQILRANELIDERALQPTSERILIPELLPGDYTFKVIHDTNKNGRWDVGKLSTRTQPESVDVYSNPAKVRANWEVEVQLIPKSESR